jgi:hypothetical protein
MEYGQPSIGSRSPATGRCQHRVRSRRASAAALRITWPHHAEPPPLTDDGLRADAPLQREGPDYFQLLLPPGTRLHESADSNRSTNPD